MPPNLYFELEDCTREWTLAENTFDFVHMRYLFGAIADWEALFREAYRACKPGGWVQSCEADPFFNSDDGTLTDALAMATCTELYIESEKKLGRSFHVIKQGLQKKGMEAAGFTDIHITDYKVRSWSRSLQGERAEKRYEMIMSSRF